MHTVLAQGQGSCVEAQPPWLVKGTHKLIPFDSSLSEEGSQGTRHVVGHKRIRGEALSKFDFLWLPLQRLFIFCQAAQRRLQKMTLCALISGVASSLWVKILNKSPVVIKHRYHLPCGATPLHK